MVDQISAGDDAVGVTFSEITAATTEMPQARGLHSSKGVTLVHFSAYPELFLSLTPTSVSHRKCLR